VSGNGAARDVFPIPEKTLDDELPRYNSCLSGKRMSGNWSIALGVFLRSLFIQSSFNYQGMQNLGFAFSMLPLAGRLAGNRERVASLLTRHLQQFNTHPYLSGPIIGSVFHIEAERIDAGDGNGKAGEAEAANLKNILMGPYAALGDSFFWGALKPFASVLSVLVALQQSVLAIPAFLLLYNPSHLWIRYRGFMEGYRSGKAGIEFIRRLDMQRLTRKIRWISLMGLGGMAAFAARFPSHISFGFPFYIIANIVLLCLMLLCFWGIRKGISQAKMLYWIFIIGCVVSL
jgi:mannose PTS system EIID component